MGESTEEAEESELPYTGYITEYSETMRAFNEEYACPHVADFNCIYADNCRSFGYNEQYPECPGNRKSAGTECNECEFEFECRDSTMNGGSRFSFGCCPHGGPH